MVTIRQKHLCIAVRKTPQRLASPPPQKRGPFVFCSFSSRLLFLAGKTFYYADGNYRSQVKEHEFLLNVEAIAACPAHSHRAFEPTDRARKACPQVRWVNDGSATDRCLRTTLADGVRTAGRSARDRPGRRGNPPQAVWLRPAASAALARRQAAERHKGDAADQAAFGMQVRP